VQIAAVAHVIVDRSTFDYVAAVAAVVGIGLAVVSTVIALKGPWSGEGRAAGLGHRAAC
jgi:hypothetical protein